MGIFILEAMVLRLPRNYRNDIFALGEEDDENKANWHATYMQFIMWQHGCLGQGDRTVIFSCCVWRIRDQCPDPFGQYIRTILGRLKANSDYSENPLKRTYRFAIQTGALNNAYMG